MVSLASHIEEYPKCNKEGPHDTQALPKDSTGFKPPMLFVVKSFFERGVVIGIPVVRQIIGYCNYNQCKKE